MNYNRKTFIKTTALATAGILTSDILKAAEWKRKQKFGIQLYTVRIDAKKDIVSTIQYVARAGYSQLETYGFDGKHFFGKTPKEFKQLLDDNNMVSPSGHYGSGGVLFDGKMDYWKTCLDAAAELGSKFVIVPYIEEKYRTEESYKKAFESINVMAELTKKAGMKLAYHNHEFEFKQMANGKTVFENLLLNTDASMMDMEMDLYWVVYGGSNPVEWINKYPGRFSMWHIKDMTTEDGKRKSTQVGDGTIDFASVFALRKKAGLQYGYVEQEEYSMPEEECIKKSIAYLKKKKWGN